MASRSTSVKVTLKVSSFILHFLMNIIFYILVAVSVIYTSKAAYDFTYQIYGPDAVDDPANARQIYIRINKGDSTMDIAEKLELYHAIKNKYSFALKVKLQELVLMPGLYRIDSSMTYAEILNIITDYSKSEIQVDDPEEEETGQENTSGEGTQTGQENTSGEGTQTGQENASGGEASAGQDN
jgi:UPF0755 protein